MRDSFDALDVPGWVLKNCPEVVSHYIKFPLFRKGWDEELLALSDTTSAATGTCIMKVVRDVAASIDSQALLHAGSHLGAIIHGGQIPWDDDIDAILPLQDRDKFLQRCAGLQEKGIPVYCYVHSNAVKVFSDVEVENRTRHAWAFPFVDLFFYVVRDGFLLEVPPHGYVSKWAKSFPLDAYFPLSPYYFGGVRLLGPDVRVALDRYDVDRCKVPEYNHRISLNLKKQFARHTNGSLDVDCGELSLHFPFLRDGGISNDGISTWKVHEFSNMTLPQPAQKISLQLRRKYFTYEQDAGDMLTQKIQSLDEVEVVNTFSPGCKSMHDISVIVFNMQRGGHWLVAAEMLRTLSPDIIILNEMDIGMSRSGQQHTASLLALELQMNYAWALEFVELTRGTKHEQIRTQNHTDFEGLHGNAILSRCKLHDPVVYRDKIGAYFSDKKVGLNANGYEKRLGGRMILLVKAAVDDGRTIVLGSMHKGSLLEEVKRYTDGYVTILGGDQGKDTCGKLGLALSENSNHTWPVSCTTGSYGRGTGDILCASANENVVLHSKVYLPCFTSSGQTVQISDHAVVYSELSMEKLFEDKR